jgi:hypothetical protein
MESEDEQVHQRRDSDEGATNDLGYPRQRGLA